MFRSCNKYFSALLALPRLVHNVFRREAAACSPNPAHRSDGDDTTLSLVASATSATADGLAPEGASQTKKFCLQVIKKRPRKKFCLQVIKKRPRKPDVADVHEWCSAATELN
ncbi:hypothetical protein EVAR_36193_1 [Eumeta japonica]|uniref:Uncharacterized protein n=1 Tax=Eumeta variegata TaxID=151549 RepID=A0A4C1VSX8_EUMVA|nr:hypothetical protein EVAR_36193_1 [Eumeta japonica]